MVIVLMDAGWRCLCLSNICKTKRCEENWKEGGTVSVMAQTGDLTTKSDTVQYPHPRVLIRLSEDTRDKYTVRHKGNKKEGEPVFGSERIWNFNGTMEPVFLDLPSQKSKDSFGFALCNLQAQYVALINCTQELSLSFWFSLVRRNNFTEHSPQSIISNSAHTLRTLISSPERSQKSLYSAESPRCAGSSESRSWFLLILILLDQVSHLVVNLHHPEPPEVAGLTGGGLAPLPPCTELLLPCRLVHMETWLGSPDPWPFLHLIPILRG